MKEVAENEMVTPKAGLGSWPRFIATPHPLGGAEGGAQGENGGGAAGSVTS